MPDIKKPLLGNLTSVKISRHLHATEKGTQTLSVLLEMNFNRLSREGGKAVRHRDKATLFFPGANSQGEEDRHLAMLKSSLKGLGVRVTSRDEPVLFVKRRES